MFNNTGTVNVNAGTLLMQSGGTSTGTYNLAAGALIEFRNGAHTLNNVTTSGAGTLQISTENVGADALVTINGGTLNSAFLLSGSTMNGTDQVFQGPATWTGGTLTGTAAQSTTFNGTLTISGSNTKVLSGGRSVNAGNTTWTGNTGNGNNAIAISQAGAFNNTGTFTDANAFDSAINVGGGGGTFNNTGIFNKQSNTTTAVGTVFNSTGTVNVNAGTMLMNGGGTDTGVFNIANGAKLEFRNGSHTLNNVTTSGAGTFEISTENVGADATVALNGGTHTTAFVLSGSILTGTSHTFQGLATWTGGTITGAATASTTFANDLTISGPNSKTLSGGRSVNAGNTTWTGNTGNGNNSHQHFRRERLQQQRHLHRCQHLRQRHQRRQRRWRLQQQRHLQQAVEHHDRRRYAVQQHRHGQCERRHDADERRRHRHRRLQHRGWRQAGVPQWQPHAEQRHDERRWHLRDQHRQRRCGRHRHGQRRHAHDPVCPERQHHGGHRCHVPGPGDLDRRRDIGRGGHHLQQRRRRSPVPI